MVTLAKNQDIPFEECRGRMLLYDPLCENDADKNALKSLLREVQPVGRGHDFKITLNAQDEILLHSIADECASSISSCMFASDIQGAIKHWNLLDSGSRYD